MSRVVLLDPIRAPHVDLNNEKQFNRLRRRFEGFKELRRSIPKDDLAGQKFKERFNFLRDMYRGFLLHVDSLEGLEDAKPIERLKSTGVGGAMFLFGMIRNLDRAVESYWEEKLKDAGKLGEILPDSFSFFARGKGLVGKVNKLINRFSEGEIDGKGLEGGINKSLSEAVPREDQKDYVLDMVHDGIHEDLSVFEVPEGTVKRKVTVDDIRDKYETLRQTQYSSAHRGYIHGVKLDFQRLLEGITVPPKKDEIGMNLAYQLERFGRRVRGLGGTDLSKDKDYISFSGFIYKIFPMLKSGSDMGEEAGNAIIAQSLNLLFSETARNWMEKKIKKIEKMIPDFEYSGDFLSDLRNLSKSMSHAARNEKVPGELVGMINDFMEFGKDYAVKGISAGALKTLSEIAPKVQILKSDLHAPEGRIEELKKAGLISARSENGSELLSTTKKFDRHMIDSVKKLWDGLNRVLTTSKYRSHLGVDITFGPLSAIKDGGYQLENQAKNRSVLLEDIKEDLKKYTGELPEKPTKEEFNKKLKEVIHSDQYGPEVAHGIVRMMMDKADFDKETKFAIEKGQSREFREKARHMQDLDDMLLIMNMTAGGGDEAAELLEKVFEGHGFGELFKGRRSSVSHEVLLGIPKVKEMAERIIDYRRKHNLMVPRGEGGVTADDIRWLSESALTVHGIFNLFDNFTRARGRRLTEEDAEIFKPVIDAQREKLKGPFAPVFKMIERRKYNLC